MSASSSTHAIILSVPEEVKKLRDARGSVGKTDCKSLSSTLHFWSYTDDFSSCKLQRIRPGDIWNGQPHRTRKVSSELFLNYIFSDEGSTEAIQMWQKGTIQSYLRDISRMAFQSIEYSKRDFLNSVIYYNLYARTLYNSRIIRLKASPCGTVKITTTGERRHSSIIYI
jgi:hypothetical protein